MIRYKKEVIMQTWVINSGSKCPKINKNHKTQKMFRLGISFGRNDFNLEGHLQVGFNSKTIKNYKPVDNTEQDCEILLKLKHLF